MLDEVLDPRRPGTRLGNHQQALPLRQSLEPPKLDLWVDTTLTVAAGTPTAGVQVTALMEDRARVEIEATAMVPSTAPSARTRTKLIRLPQGSDFIA